jgi:hypothetical protein
MRIHTVYLPKIAGHGDEHTVVVSDDGPFDQFVVVGAKDQEWVIKRGQGATFHARVLPPMTEVRESLWDMLRSLLLRHPRREIGAVEKWLVVGRDHA